MSEIKAGPLTEEELGRWEHELNIDASEQSGTDLGDLYYRRGIAVSELRSIRAEKANAQAMVDRIMRRTQRP